MNSKKNDIKTKAKNFLLKKVLISILFVIIIGMLFLTVYIIFLSDKCYSNFCLTVEFDADITENEKIQLETSMDRLTLLSDTFEVNIGSEKIYYYALRNNYNESYGKGTFALQDYIYCDDSLIKANLSAISFNTFLFENLYPGENRISPLDIESSNLTIPTTYYCHFDICYPHNVTSTEGISTKMCPNGNSYAFLNFKVIIKD